MSSSARWWRLSAHIGRDGRGEAWRLLVANHQLIEDLDAVVGVLTGVRCDSTRRQLPQ